VVLLRAAPGLQQHRGTGLQNLSGTEAVRSDDHQPPAGGRLTGGFEATDSGLLSPELAAGIRRVQGVRRIGVRVGNWLTAEQSKRLLASVRIGIRSVVKGTTPFWPR